MAELLFKLKNDFEIVDVEFPQIPTNAVYNADKVKYNNDADAIGGEVDLDNNIDPDQTDELGGEIDGMGMDAAGGEMGGDASGLGMDDGGEDGGLDGGLDGAAGGLGGPDDQGDLTDDESVSDFSEPETSSGGVEGLLKSILAMLTADADAKKAQAEAEGEKARALQAEYTAKAASASVEQQAELLSMEQSVESQKKKEKEARRISDLAKHRVKQTNGMSSALESIENKSRHIDYILFEVENGDTPRSVIAAMQALRSSGLPPAEINLAMRELTIRLQRVKLAEKNRKLLNGNQQNNQQGMQQANQQGMQQNNQQGMQQGNPQQRGNLGSMR